MALKAYKYRIYPDAQQKVLIEKTFGCVRKVYNLYVSWNAEQYRKFKDSGEKYGKKPEVSAFKRQFGFLKEVDTNALSYAKMNFEKASSGFMKSLKGQRKGRRIGLPSMKKKGKCRFSYQTAGRRVKFISKSWIRLPKVGSVKIRKHRELKGVMRTCTVSRTGNYHYYISILCELPGPEKPLATRKNRTNIVGLDMSLPKFLVSSDGRDDAKIKYRHDYRKEERRLKRLESRVGKKVRGSKNREKARARLASLHERVANRRKEFIILTALYLARKYDAIVIEDLDMQAMSRALRLGKSVMDLGWGIFRGWLRQECQKYGTELVIANKWYASSKTCHHCGAKDKALRLSDREWTCPSCGTFISDRDRNAALNLRDYYFSVNEINTDAMSGIEACGDRTSTTKSADFVASPAREAGKVSSMDYESIETKPLPSGRGS